MSRGKTKNSRKTPPPDETPDDILGISQTATSDEIRAAYLQKVRLSPPEKDARAFQQIRRAYGLLIDGEKKNELDRSLFKRESQLDVDSGVEYDFTAIARRRLFQLLLSSSDFYVKDFSRHFSSIEKSVENLR